MKDLLYRSQELKRRSVNEVERSAEFVAATEIGVDSWFGREFLRVGGMKLARYAANPVFLDTHNRYECGAVIGRAEMRVEGRELIAKVVYASTKRAEDVWELVRTGFLRAVSVGFAAIRWKELEAGQADGEGEARVEGPGIVIDESELYELSQCPVPADQNALLRSSLPAPFGRGIKPAREGVIDYSKALAPAPLPSTFPQALATAAAPPPAPVAPSTPAIAPAVRADGEGEADEEATSAEEARKKLAELYGLDADASWDDVVAAAEEDEADEDEAGEDDEPAEKKKADEDDEPADKKNALALDLERRRREILAIAPPALRALGELLVLEGVDVDAARKRLLAEYTARSVPVGTPEPPPPTKPTSEKNAQQRVLGASDEAFARAFAS